MIWDTDNNGMIDALELFSGIALNSEAKLDDILRCKLYIIKKLKISKICFK